MSTKLKYKQVANVERRTWDKEAYEARAKARQEAESSSSTTTNNNNDTINNNINVESNNNKEEFQAAIEGAAGPLNSKRAYLKSRTKKVDLDSKLGTCEIVHPDSIGVTSTGITSTDDGIAGVDTDTDATAAASATPKITDGVTKSISGIGWHCRVCDCFLKDSMTYLDHINGRKHQRKLGYSMRVEQSTTDQVKHTLQVLKSKKSENEKKKNDTSIGTISSTSTRIRKKGFSIGLEEEEEDEEEKGHDMKEDEYEAMVRRKDEERMARRAKRRDERKKKHLLKQAQMEQKENEEEEEEEDNPAEDGNNQEEDDTSANIAAMMGFSSFGGMGMG